MMGYFDKGKKTKREQFLAEKNQVVPWARFCALVEPRIRKPVRQAVARHCRLSACFASTVFNNAATSRTPGPRRRFTIRSRCACSLA